VAAAVTWLERHRFLDVEESAGAPNRLTLLEETGSQRNYHVPGAEISRLRAAGEDWGAHRYVKVPLETWTNGWLVALSGSALAMFLVLLVRGAGRDGEVWFSPSVADDRYRLSPDTRQRGLRDLQVLGLVEVKRRPLTRHALDVVRLRNTYTLRMGVLQHPADIVLGPRTRRRIEVQE